MKTNRQSAILLLLKQANIADGDKSLLATIAGEFFDAFNDLRIVAESVRNKAPSAAE